ncbi:helix-turn-helix domain-containing protein [Draconibacterium sp.]|uniref:helix-turn-helix domain-containing protein n=1 Tax=Draconibacterium sp. TaxID=1965318 RepID=UPI003565C852
MLRYNFERIFKARGIYRPYSYLVNAGFSGNFAVKLNKNQAAYIRPKEMEKLCLLLRCTPNDFFEWIPDNENTVDSKHPINNIRKTEKVVDITKTLNAVPIDKLDEIEQLINEKLASGKS